MTVTDQPARTPTPAPAPAPAIRGQNRRAFVVIAIIVIALGFVLFRGLGNATLFFRTASEAVSQFDDLGERRFRIQGIVLDGSITASAHGTDFVIEENGVDVTVRHRGDPPELFKPNVPVVLEGRFAPGTQKDAPVYDSDRILVKHGNEYGAKNPERVVEYTEPVTVGAR